MKFLLVICLLLSPIANAETLKLTGNDTLVFGNSIDFASMNMLFYATLAKRSVLPKEKQLHIIIASGGGEYAAARLFFGISKYFNNVSYICKYCASAASYIFSGSTHMKRYAIEKSVVLMHEMFCAKTTAATYRSGECLKDLQRSSDEFNKVLYTVMGISKDYYDKKILGTEWTVTGQDIVKLHLADEFVTLACDEEVMAMAPKTCSPKKD